MNYAPKSGATVMATIGALLLFGATIRADAQFLGVPGGSSMIPLGRQGPINLGGYSTPFFMVSPRGITPGYLGPNGPYQTPANRFEAGFYPNGGAIGSTPSGSLVAPFNATGSLNDPSLVTSENPTGARALAASGAVPIPRTSDSIEARIDKDNRLIVKWAGDPQTAASIRFALLDKDNQVIKEEKITRLPAEARLSITSKTSYYRVTVEYINGTSTNVISPL
jgi:hypothetical protein